MQGVCDEGVFGGEVVELVFGGFAGGAVGLGWGRSGALSVLLPD
jgi:hypothetical protein